jgi:hypothetical protein
MFGSNSARHVQRLQDWRRGCGYSVVDWIVFAALIFLQLWLYGEIVFCLIQTSKLKALSALFFVIALAAVCTITTRPLDLHRSELNASNRCIGRAVSALFVLNFATAVLALVTALILKASYDFQTPLLRFSALLLNQLWR